MLCLAGRGVRRDSWRRLRRLGGKWLGPRLLRRLGLRWRQRLGQREVRSGRCGGGRYLGPCCPRAARDPGEPGWEGPLLRPPVPGCPPLTPYLVLLAFPQRVSPPRALLPPRPFLTAPPKVRGARAPIRPLLAGAGRWCAWELVLSQGGGETTPLSFDTGPESLWPVLFSC